MSAAAESKHWKVHTSRLLEEIAQCSGNAIYAVPLTIFGRLLAAVGERAAELHDPQLDDLMCRLTIYTVADPESADYDPLRLLEVRRAAQVERRKVVPL